MTLFIDLDGTLIDVADRYWRLYEDITDKFTIPRIPRERYWRLKREKAPVSRILEESGVTDGATVQAYLAEFATRVEDPKYLAFDTLFEAAVPALRQLTQHGTLYLVSIRTNRAGAMDQLERFGILPFFREFLSGHPKDDPAEAKAQLIGSVHTGSPGIVIGDTEADTGAAWRLGMKAITVTSGLRSREYLAVLRPDAMAEDIGDIPAILRHDQRESS